MREETIVCDRCHQGVEFSGLRVRDWQMGEIDLCSSCYSCLRDWVKAGV